MFVFFLLGFFSQALHTPEVGRLMECRSAKLCVQRLMCEHADCSKDARLLEVFWCSFSDIFRLWSWGCSLACRCVFAQFGSNSVSVLAGV